MSFFEILKKCTSVHLNVIHIIIDVFNMSRQFLSKLVGIGSSSHNFDDELKISFLISVTHSKTFIFDLITGCCTKMIKTNSNVFK